MDMSNKMKVIVCFGSMRVIVPCNDLDLKVSDLINRAVQRYRKASQKESYEVVRVHCLKTVEENAILDIDDLVVDVCSDKDMLIAVYDETTSKPIPRHSDDHSGGLDNNNISTPVKSSDDFGSHYNTSALSDNDSGVAADSYGISSNPPSTHASLNSSSRPPRGIQRKFPHTKNNSFRSSVSSNSPASSPELSRHQGLKPGAFSRDTNRKSLSSNHPMLYSWIDQQQGIGTPGYYADNNDTDENESEKSFGQEEITLDQPSIQSVDIKPYSTASQKEVGLVVHGVVEGSYMDRVGELQMADLITEVNGISLANLTNEQAFKIYNDAIKSDIIRLKRTRSHTFLKDQIKMPALKQDVPDDLLRTREAPKPAPVIQPAQPHEAGIEAPNADKGRESFTIGNKHIFYVNLVKGTDGLGFTVTSKDVLTSQTRDFFIKTILNKGAAIKDGRLKAGDQLLKINNVPIHNKSQTEVVKMLRASQGMVVLQLARPKSDVDNAAMDDTAMGDDALSHIDHPPDQHEEVLKLTIPLSSQGSAGLGISVKGRHNEDTEDDLGIYIKSVIKGGAAAKDGRLKINDQLLCINDTSLIGLSNADAMSVLRASLDQSMQKGSILIIVGRSSKPLSGFISRGTSPLKGATPHKGHSPIQRRNSNSEKLRDSPSFGKSPKIINQLTNQETENRFNDLYLKKTPSHNIARNKSYFKAVGPRIHSDSDTENNSGNNSPRTVSVSSQDLPEIQKSVYLDNAVGKPPTSDTHRSSKILPSYEEAVHRKNSNASSNSGKTAPSTSSRKENLPELSKFQILPDKMSNIPSEESHRRTKSNIENRSSSYDELNNLAELTRTESVVSQSSLDSMFVGPNKIPFSRDGFGRSSMSERKGRAHIDATKSDFYKQLKKYKSMEELRGHSIDAPDVEELKKTESVDTIISRLDEEELKQSILNFQRGTKYSSSTPWFTHASEDTKAGKRAATKKKSKTLPKPSCQSNYNNAIKLRSPNKHKRKSRPYSCVVDSSRVRNSMLNESFKIALDQKAKIDLRALKSDEDKKKNKGLFKGISTLLKRNKKTKDDQQRSQSPEYISTDHKHQNGHRLSLNFDATKDSEKLSERFFKQDKLQKELVQAKINEMEQNKKELKKRKSDPALNQHINQPYGGQHYNPWEMHDAKNVRERSKQFYEHSDLDNASIRSSNRSIQLKRQSSLPPRNKKDNEDYHRKLPRTPSVDKSPELGSKRKQSSNTSNSAPNSKPSTPNRRTNKSPFDSLPRKLKNKEKIESEQKRYSSITDLTRKDSVSISHQAQI